LPPTANGIDAKMPLRKTKRRTTTEQVLFRYSAIKEINRMFHLTVHKGKQQK